MPAHALPVELKEQALLKLLPPYNWSIRHVSKEMGVAIGTVFKWRKQLEEEGLLVPEKQDGQDYSADQIFAFVLETATMSEYQLAEYCRTKGLFVDQVKSWKKNCVKANLPESTKQGPVAKEIREDKKRIKTLEKELKRKERALAETAALLVLREKCNALWEEKGEE